MATSKQNVTGQVGIYREGQSQYVCELKVGEKVYNWYDWNSIPKCFKTIFVGNNSNYAKISVDIREDGSYPSNVKVIEYLV